MFRPLLGHLQVLWENRSHSWICFPRWPENDLIKVETCRPDNVLFLLYIKQSVVLTDTYSFSHLVFLLDVDVVNLTALPLYYREKPLYPLNTGPGRPHTHTHWAFLRRCPSNTRPGGSHSHPGRFSEEKISCVLLGFKTRIVLPVV